MDTKLVVELLEQALQELRRPDDGGLPPPRRKVQKLFSPEFWALVEICGMDRDEVSRSPGRIAKALKAICKSTPDVTALEMNLRAHRYSLMFHDCAITPESFAKHWQALTPDRNHESPLQEV